MPRNVIYPTGPQLTAWPLQSFVDMQMHHMVGCLSENIHALSRRESGQMRARSLSLTREHLGAPCDGHSWEPSSRLLGQQKDWCTAALPKTLWATGLLILWWTWAPLLLFF